VADRTARRSRPGAPPPPPRPPLVDLVPIKPRVLASRVIARVDEAMARALALPEGLRACGLITATSDDALYVALDEGTKAAPADVIYARSFYGGAAYPSGPLSGEVIGVYAAEDPDEVRAALARCRACLLEEAWFYAADARGQLAFFPHVVRATGSYLSREAGIERGRPLAYLIAPPLESIVGLDAALKAAPVELAKWFGPPSETNYGGGYLVGELDACEAAARAFAAAVVDVAGRPLDEQTSARGAGEASGARPAGAAGVAGGRFKVLATGERLGEKPEHLTQLVDDESLVDKLHPRLPLRGKLDTLQGLLLDAQGAAHEDGASALVGELSEALELSRRLVGAEVTGRPLGEWTLGGMTPAEIRWASHHTQELYGVPFMFPQVQQGPVVARLAVARAYAREAELALYQAFPDEGERDDLKLALNRLSSALYLMTTRYVAGRYRGQRRQLGPIKGWKPPRKTP